MREEEVQTRQTFPEEGGRVQENPGHHLTLGGLREREREREIRSERGSNNTSWKLFAKFVFHGYFVCTWGGCTQCFA